MNYYQQNPFQQAHVTRNLLYLNVACFAVSLLFEGAMGIDLNRILGMYLWESPNFKPFQLVTHIFMHGSLMHIFFNMFTLYMFGPLIELRLGPKRYFFYYFFTALGAAFLFNLTSTYEAAAIAADHNVSTAEIVSMMPPVVGASGAIYGLLLAFGLFYPNQLLYIYFVMPIKAKYLVLIFAIFELVIGLQHNPQNNIAHFAHLGGMLFGFLLIKYWQHKKTI